MEEIVLSLQTVRPVKYKSNMLRVIDLCGVTNQIFYKVGYSTSLLPALALPGYHITLAVCG